MIGKIKNARGRAADMEAGVEKQLRRNERIWAGFRQIELAMIGARSFAEVLQSIARPIPTLFPDIACVTLACLDPEHELTRLLREQPTDEPAGSFIVLTAEQLQALFGGTARPVLGQCDRARQQLLFPAYPERLGSVAIIPLQLRGELVGTLNQGSLDAAHFHRSFATDLIEHLAAVTAMCLDNAVNYERRRLDGLTDALTGVANRRFFERRLHEETERWRRQHAPLSCLLLDVDRFKQVNDRYGHRTGDRVLRQVAELFRRELRSGDILARYGGEEFVLLLPDTPLEEAREIAERLRQKVAAMILPLAELKESLCVTVSAGVAGLATAPGAPDQPGAAIGAWLIEQADAALYRAKRSGRNRIFVCEGKTDVSVAIDRNHESSLF
jgi:diguanylate cyclase (GGDEF)-like protein